MLYFHEFWVEFYTTGGRRDLLNRQQAGRHTPLGRRKNIRELNRTLYATFRLIAQIDYCRGQGHSGEQPCRRRGRQKEPAPLLLRILPAALAFALAFPAFPAFARVREWVHVAGEDTLPVRRMGLGGPVFLGERTVFVGA